MYICAESVPLNEPQVRIGTVGILISFKERVQPSPDRGSVCEVTAISGRDRMHQVTFTVAHGSVSVSHYAAVRLPFRQKFVLGCVKSNLTELRKRKDLS